MARTVDVLLIEDLSRQRLPARMMVAALERAGFSFRVLNSGDEKDSRSIVESAKQLTPRLIVISLLFADRIEEYLSLLPCLREAIPSAHLSLSGHLPGLAAHAFLNAYPALDSVLPGEAETSVASLAAWLVSGKAPLVGVVTRESRAGIAAPEGLDSFPFAWRGDGVSFRPGYGFATIESSRGCYHACSFCLPRASDRNLGFRYRVWSIPHVADEIEALYQLGTRLFLFDDEEFLPPDYPRGARMQRAEHLIAELERRRLTIAFTIKARPDDVEFELFRRLRDAGLVRVYLGIESGNGEVLNRLHKGIQVEDSRAALETLDRLDIVQDFQILLFHPWSTLETLEGDLKFLETVLPFVRTLYSFRELQVYAGTRLARSLPSSDGNSPVIGYAMSDRRAEFVRRLFRLAHGNGSMQSKLAEKVSEALFDRLVCRRLGLAGNCQEALSRLTMVARATNHANLDVLGRACQFAAGPELSNAAAGNRIAAECAWTWNSGAASGLELLAEIERQEDRARTEITGAKLAYS